MGVTIEDIDSKLPSLSDESLEAVFEFVMKLSERDDENIDSTLLSEAALAKDWETSEEDEAWRYLDALPSC
jgi:hypothetical protein